MKPLFISIATAVMMAFGLPLYAQHGHNHQGRQEMNACRMADMRTAEMRRALVLTSQQLRKVEKLNLAFSEEMVKLMHRSPSASRDKAMRSEWRKYDRKLSRILNDRQYAVWKNNPHYYWQGHGEWHNHGYGYDYGHGNGVGHPGKYPNKPSHRHANNGGKAGKERERGNNKSGGSRTSPRGGDGRHGGR